MKSVIVRFVYRIFRSCSSWSFFHKGIEEAKQILLKNQYPLAVIEETIHKTLTKILTGVDDSDENSDELELDPNANFQNISEKDKFLFFVNYRGKPTEHFATSLKKLNAPCKVIMTLNKTKNCLSTLKNPIPFMLQSNVVYIITCPQCTLSYVGQTSRHIQQRFNEHIGTQGKFKKHFKDCGVEPREDMIKILGRAKGERLLILEALFISEIKPVLNTKLDFKSRTLKLKF